MKNRLIQPAWALAAMLWLVAGCHNTPTKTTGSSVLGVDISGPATIAPGQSGQFTAVILPFAPGSERFTETPHVEWRSSDAAILQLTNSGIGTAGQQRGEVVVSAEVRTSTGGVGKATKEVMILPDGTFRLIGTVLDAEDPQLPVANASVEAVPGLALTQTDSAGKYRLYGAPANARILVRADGYRELQQDLHLTANSAYTVQLTASEPTDLLAGDYTVSFDVTDACTNGGTVPPLAPELRHRRYAAILTRSGANIDVTLSGPGFRPEPGPGNHFSGTLYGSHATFTILDESYYAGETEVIERLPDNTYLIVAGRAVTRFSGSSWSGQTSGAGDVGSNGLAQVDSEDQVVGTKLLAGCFNAMRFTLTRR